MRSIESEPYKNDLASDEQRAIIAEQMLRKKYGGQFNNLSSKQIEEEINGLIVIWEGRKLEFLCEMADMDPETLKPLVKEKKFVSKPVSPKKRKFNHIVTFADKSQQKEDEEEDK